jgi:drug/metabolite transporter (DMT)-like permease
MNKFLLAIPAACDCLASTLQYIALNFIPGSVYQMMRGGTIVVTFLLSIVFLKVKVQKYQIVGSCLAFIGVFVVGLSNLIYSSSSSSSSSSVMTIDIIGFPNNELCINHYLSSF